MREIVVDVQHVSKSFGSEQVLEDVTLQLMRGKIHGIIGRNGSGKTVLMKCICGFLRPTAGKISVFGKNIGTDCDFAPKTGMLIETPGFLPHETGMSNLLWLAKLGNGARCEDVAALMRLVGLDPAAKKRVSQYSLGMRQRLGIAVALAGNPDFLVLDEPVNGLDPQGIVEIRELILKLNRERGITVVISSHLLDELARLATHYGFIDGGRMGKGMSAQELEVASRKCMQVAVSDTGRMARALDQKKAEYQILSDTQANIYTEISISELVDCLEKQGCRLMDAQKREESLESFYMNLMGGERHA